MNVNFYSTSSPNNMANKQLTQIGTTQSCYLKEDTSKETPTLLIENPPAGANYFGIPEWGYYYFITNEESVSASLWNISGEIDPLMSVRGWKDCEAVIARQEKLYNMYLHDPLLKYDERPDTFTINFPETLSSGWEYVLVVMGNSQNEE